MIPIEALRSPNVYGKLPGKKEEKMDERRSEDVRKNEPFLKFEKKPHAPLTTTRSLFHS